MDVYAVFCRGNMFGEGSRTFDLDCVFTDLADAINYMNLQKGVEGRPAFNDHQAILAEIDEHRRWTHSGLYEPCQGWICDACRSRGSADWKIQRVSLVDSLTVSEDVRVAQLPWKYED